MKKIGVMILSILLALSLAACGESDGSGNSGGTPSVTEYVQPQSSATPQPTEDTQPAPEETDATSQESTEATSQESGELVYEFEFTDIDGNVHKLSDYRGKPVYLRVWASWCGVCTSSLESLDKLAGEAKDFVVLSVVMPTLSGEKSANDFIKWYKDLGYKNLTVMLDPYGQIVSDFGINAFPSQIMFDAEGHVVYGVVGLMTSDQITETMEGIANESE